MEEGSKRRLVGTAVVVMLLVVFLPMLLEEEPANPVPDSDLEIPPRPGVDSEPYQDTESTDSSAETYELPGMPQLPPPDRYEPSASVSVPLPDPAPAVLPAAEPEPAPPTVAVSESAPDPAPARLQLDGPGWVVQVSSLTELPRAQSLERELRAKGFPTFIERAQVNGKTYHRVRVGPKAERDDIEAMAASLRTKAGHQGQILRYP